LAKSGKNPISFVHQVPDFSIQQEEIIAIQRRRIMRERCQKKRTTKRPAPAHRTGGTDVEPLRLLWGKDDRVLTYDGDMIRTLDQPAPLLEAILTGFEKRGWPKRIKSPLPRVSGTNPKVRLHDAIKRLNHHQHGKRCRIVFAGDGTGMGIKWKVVRIHR
jgi:hypothetical protein